jgi:hypothetical protein
MPAIAEFNGITIRIYYWPGEYPPPHFHAICGDQEASFDIDTLEVIAATSDHTVNRGACVEPQGISAEDPRQGSVL